MEKPNNGTPGKISYCQRLAQSLANTWNLIKKYEKSQWLTIQNMPDAEKFIIMIPTLHVGKMKS